MSSWHDFASRARPAGPRPPRFVKMVDGKVVSYGKLSDSDAADPAKEKDAAKQ